MITLRKIDKDNFYAVVKLGVTEKQSHYVASNVFSLAQAWLYADAAKPFAIYADEVPVGFFMGEISEEDGKMAYGIWRFMIDTQHQGKGYGRAALKLAIEYLKGEGAKEIEISNDPQNDVAWSLYKSVGFVQTGEIDDGEAVAILKIAE